MISIQELETEMGHHWFWLPSGYWKAYLDFVQKPSDRLSLRALAANAVVAHVCQSDIDIGKSLNEIRARNGVGLWNYLQGQLHIESNCLSDARMLLNGAITCDVDENIKQLARAALERIILDKSFDSIEIGVDGSELIEASYKKTTLACKLERAIPLFEIIVSGLELAKIVDECISSIADQTYRNFRVHLLSDNDPGESSLQPELIKKCYRLPTMPIIKVNSTRIGKAAIIYEHLTTFDFEPHSIAVILDGDDRFATKAALTKFASVYSLEKPDVCWSTYIRSDGVLGHSAPLIRGIPHRKQGWRSSHCFTFRANLIKRVPRSYILDEAGIPVMQACDLALALPILDLAEKTSFIPEALYYYTVDNPHSHHNQPDGMGLTSTRQIETAQYLYAKIPLDSSF
jgi:hypothetical protein